MKYVNATTVLPNDLLKEIQKYVQGEALYIPKPITSYHKWGSRSGGRRLLDERNSSIRERFENGDSITQLAEEFHLSIESIKKIVYSTKFR